MNKLTQILKRIDGRGYPAYKDLRGSYRDRDFELHVEHVQGDPFAAPSRLSVTVPLSSLEIRPQDLEDKSRRTGIEDAIRRDWFHTLKKAPQGRGSGKSGQWGFLTPRQELIPTTSCEVLDTHLCLRFTLGLPAQGRRVLGREAHTLLTQILPQIVERALFQSSPEHWSTSAELSEDQDFLRQWLVENDALCFIANGAILPRESGVDDRPLSDHAVEWESPRELLTTLNLPNHGEISGSLWKRGIHLICGGGYHGKSTLLQAIARGVYNHILDDGREFCITRSDAVTVRAEDGRAINHDDISPFIQNLPSQQETESFSTQNASGSTSQAANIVEAIELGTQCLLIDEDTSATNFMVRDRRMQALIETHKEPITPFIDRIQQLNTDLNVSSILVVGGSGDYFEVCDEVTVMDHYRPHIATPKAKDIAIQFPSSRLKEERPALRPPRPRHVDRTRLDTSRGRKSERVRAVRLRSIEFGTQEIDLSLVGQLVDEGQTRLIGDWLVELARNSEPNGLTLAELCAHFESTASQQALSSTLTGRVHGDRVWARSFELAAAINRLRNGVIDTGMTGEKD